MASINRSLSFPPLHWPNLGAGADIFCKALSVFVVMTWCGASYCGCPLGKANLEPQAKLMLNLRIGSMRLPQSAFGLRLQMISSFVLDPVPAAHLFSTPDIDRLQRMMDAAHALHNVNAFSPDYAKAKPGSKVVDPRLLLELTKGILHRVAYDLISLVALLSPGNSHASKTADAFLQSILKDSIDEQPYSNPDVIEQIDSFFKTPNLQAIAFAQAIHLFLQSPQGEALSKRQISTIEAFLPDLAADPAPHSAARRQLDARMMESETEILRELKAQMSRSHPDILKLTENYLSGLARLD